MEDQARNSGRVALANVSTGCHWLASVSSNFNLWVESSRLGCQVDNWGSTQKTRAELVNVDEAMTTQPTETASAISEKHWQASGTLRNSRSQSTLRNLPGQPQTPIVDQARNSAQEVRMSIA